MIIKSIINSWASEGDGKLPICSLKEILYMLQRRYARQKPRNAPPKRYLIMVVYMGAWSTIANNSQKIYVSRKPIHTS